MFALLLLVATVPNATGAKLRTEESCEQGPGVTVALPLIVSFPPGPQWAEPLTVEESSSSRSVLPSSTAVLPEFPGPYAPFDELYPSNIVVLNMRVRLKPTYPGLGGLTVAIATLVTSQV